MAEGVGGGEARGPKSVEMIIVGLGACVRPNPDLCQMRMVGVGVDSRLLVSKQGMLILFCY